jgi:hypothetical protein
MYMYMHMYMLVCCAISDDAMESKVVYLVYILIGSVVHTVCESPFFFGSAVTML